MPRILNMILCFRSFLRLIIRLLQLTDFFHCQKVAIDRKQRVKKYEVACSYIRVRL